MKCKVVVNKDSGNCEKLNLPALVEWLGDNVTVEEIDGHSCWNADGFDTVVVCGGDGTLHNAVQKCRGKKLFYVPCGTLNELASTQKNIHSLGCVNGMPFSYVCAAGSFTEIGYSVQTKHKKRWKTLAYLPQVLKFFRCHEMPAKLNVDGKKFQGNFTLLMVLKSHRCFGLPFNSDFKKTQKNYLLAVKSFGKDNVRNRAKMFFPFFRIFFCGAKPQIRKNWLLLPFDKLTVQLENPQNFCLDGEKRLLRGVLHFSEQQLDLPITVLKGPFCGPKKRPFSAKNPVKNR